MKVTRMAEFLNSVLKRTRDGRIPWKRTADDNIFTAVVGEGQFVLKSFEFTEYGGNGEAEGPPTLGIFTKENEIILDITAGMPDVTQGVLTEIFNIARSQAAGVDEAIDTILRSLSDV